MIAKGYVMILLHRIGMGLGEKYQMKHLLGREGRLNPKMIMSLMMTEFRLWPVMNLILNSDRVQANKNILQQGWQYTGVHIISKLPPY